jgi:hypothetical protein
MANRETSPAELSGTRHGFRAVLLMPITPRPGVNRQNLLDALRDIDTAAYNLRGGRPGTAHGRLAGYLRWATSTVQRFGNQVSAADLDQMALTRSYDRLPSIAGTMTGDDITTQRVLNGQVSLELTERVGVFEAAIKCPARADRALVQARRLCRRGHQLLHGARGQAGGRGRHAAAADPGRPRSRARAGR